MINNDHINRIIAIIADDDDLDLMIRDMLINDELAAHDFDALPPRDAALMRALLELIRSLDRETITELRLAYSLCPLHAIDYAICFDDDDPECALIRAIHPSHDT